MGFSHRAESTTFLAEWSLLEYAEHSGSVADGADGIVGRLAIEYNAAFEHTRTCRASLRSRISTR